MGELDIFPKYCRSCESYGSEKCFLSKKEQQDILASGLCVTSETLDEKCDVFHAGYLDQRFKQVMSELKRDEYIARMTGSDGTIRS